MGNAFIFTYLFLKNLLYKILYQLTKFQYRNLFTSQDIKQFVFKFQFRRPLISSSYHKNIYLVAIFISM